MMGLLARLALPQWLRDALPTLGAIAIAVGLLWALYARGNHYRDKLLAANAQIEAGKRNVTALKAEKARIEKQQAAITEGTDNETITVRTGALAAADSYARAHQCVRSPSPVPAASEPSGSVPDVSAAAGSTETAGEAVALVAVPKWGVDNCALNTADLNIAVEWARSVSAPVP